MDSKNSSPNVLTTDETKILAAIADRIFPKTDTPGAVEIGAVHYIEIALAGDYAPLVPLYRQGLRMVNRFAQEKFGRVFCQLTEAQKDAVLIDFESARWPDSNRPRSFLRPFAIMCWKGCFASRNTAAIAT